MAEFFVRRPIVAMVIAILIVLVGLVALGGLPVAQYPEITPPEVSVSATYTGANAEAVEQSVATPLEQKVNGVENMLYMKSVNSNDGTMTLTVSFEVGSDLDMSNVLVQNRVSEATASIPEEVKRLGVTVKKKLSFPLLLVSLYSPNGSYDQNFLSNYLTINILDAIARIKGVGQASVLGGSLCHAHMGQAGSTRQAWPDRTRYHQCYPGAECDCPGRTDRRAAGGCGNTVYLPGAHQGSPVHSEGIRQRGHSLEC